MSLHRILAYCFILLATATFLSWPEGQPSSSTDAYTLRYDAPSDASSADAGSAEAGPLEDGDGCFFGEEDASADAEAPDYFCCMADD